MGGGPGPGGGPLAFHGAGVHAPVEKRNARLGLVGALSSKISCPLVLRWIMDVIEMG
jgi:hypothetical protein